MESGYDKIVVYGTGSSPGGSCKVTLTWEGLDSNIGTWFPDLELLTSGLVVLVESLPAAPDSGEMTVTSALNWGWFYEETIDPTP